MANVKNITDLPMAESTEGLNLIVNDNGAAKQIAADKVGGGVSSWNDLKDKPFGEEVKETVREYVIEGKTFSGFNHIEGFSLSALCENNNTIALNEGETYTVVWDGNSYDVVARSSETHFPAIGSQIYENLLFSQAPPDEIPESEIPFLIVFGSFDNGNCWIFAEGEESEHTLSIYQDVTRPKQIEKHYIDNSYDAIIKPIDGYDIYYLVDAESSEREDKLTLVKGDFSELKKKITNNQKINIAIDEGYNEMGKRTFGYTNAFSVVMNTDIICTFLVGHTLILLVIATDNTVGWNSIVRLTVAE